MYLQSYSKCGKTCATSTCRVFNFTDSNQNELDDALRNRVQYQFSNLRNTMVSLKKHGGAKFIDKQDCAILVLDKIK